MSKKLVVGKVYKPSEMSFEDKDRRLEVYQIGFGRVLYTDLATKENGECNEEDFFWYYDEVPEEKNGTVITKEKRKD